MNRNPIVHRAQHQAAAPLLLPIVLPVLLSIVVQNNLHRRVQRRPAAVLQREVRLRVLLLKNLRRPATLFPENRHRVAPRPAALFRAVRFPVQREAAAAVATVLPSSQRWRRRLQHWSSVSQNWKRKNATANAVICWLRFRLLYPPRLRLSPTASATRFPSMVLLLLPPNTAHWSPILPALSPAAARLFTPISTTNPIRSYAL